MDSNMRLRVGATDGDLTTDETLPILPLAPMSGPLYFHLNVPSSGDTGDVSIEGMLPFMVTTGLEVGHTCIPFFTERTTFGVAFSNVSGNWGAVEVWISNNPLW